MDGGRARQRERLFEIVVPLGVEIREVVGGNRCVRAGVERTPVGVFGFVVPLCAS